MKKIIYSLFIVAGLAQCANAQKAKIETGVKGGVSLTNMFGGQTQSIKPAFHVGGFFEYPLSYYKQFSVMFELQYAMQGYKGLEYEQIDFDTPDFKVIGSKKLEDVTTHNIYLPITFNYYINKKLGLHFGGQVGYMIDAKGQYDINYANPSRQYLNYADNSLDKYLFDQGYRSTKYGDFYEKLDYGVIGGFTYAINKQFFISGRYYFGLQDIYKKDNDYKTLAMPAIDGSGLAPDQYLALTKKINKANEYLNFDPMRNMTLQISLGYKL